MSFIINMLSASWHLLLDASLYILFGIIIAGFLRIFIHPAFIAGHLGKGRFKPVLKAALFGIPLPLCSCGVLPVAASLKKQGAGNGATSAFLIATPETGIDSMAMTYALLDPLMTVARPVAAFITAILTGVITSLFERKHADPDFRPDLSCPIDQCCDGLDCLPEDHKKHHSFWEKCRAGFRYAFVELWDDMALWFLAGTLLAGLITALVPPEIMTRYLGGGLLSMLIMLAVGIPLYICATASTPIAAALILKGISPGAALVFLLAGPATNVTSLTVLVKMLGKRATVIYLIMLSLCTLAAGLLLDWVYGFFGVSAQAAAGQAAEIFPAWLQIAGAVALLALSVKPIAHAVKARITRSPEPGQNDHCGCASNSCHDSVKDPLKNIHDHRPGK